MHHTEEGGDCALTIKWDGTCKPIVCDSANVCRVPTLLVASAADRLLPSMAEAARLAGVLPDARRVTLPDSGHTALLEEGVALAAIMARAGFLPEGRANTAAAAAAGGSALVSGTVQLALWAAVMIAARRCRHC